MTVARVVIAILLLCIFPGCLLAEENPKTQTAVERRITQTLRQMYEAEKRKDLKFVFSHLAEDFAEVAGDGRVYHRADIEAGWSDVVLSDYKLSECAFRLMTNDAAYMSCEMEVDATYKGQPFPGKIRVTTFWTRQKGEWLMRFEQGTIITELPEGK